MFLLRLDGWNSHSAVAKLDKLFPCHLTVAQDLAQQANTDVLAAMNGTVAVRPSVCRSM
jgi:hypothetical protein